MGNNLKSNWKETGKELGHAFKGLGKTIVKTGSSAIKKADEWANHEEKPTEEKPEEPAQENAIALQPAEEK